MLKYFKRQKSRRESVDSDIGGDVAEEQKKRHSLRSTSSFCDEVVLEELLAAEETAGGTTADGIDVGGSSLSLSVGAAEEDAFKYHSRLAMSLPAIVNEPNCLSYFVQYLETKEALPLIKFYLDTENFKTAAQQTQLQKEHKTIAQKKLTAAIDEETDKDDDEDEVDEEEDEDEEEDNSVPELKTLCDLSMRKPLTDDEKSQIYAETNKQITKCNNNSSNNSSNSSNNSNNNHKQRTSSVEPEAASTPAASPSSLSETANDSVAAASQQQQDQDQHISAASIRDAMSIYRKYLIAHAPQFLSLPVAILSQISLLLCANDDNGLAASRISANCFDEAQRYILQQLERDYCHDFRQSNFYCRYCLELIESGGECLSIYDILYSEATLFFFMEFLEQRGERDCLDFWTTAINYRKSFAQNAEEAITTTNGADKSEAQCDAMIIYEKFFSLQSDCALWMSSQRLRCHVEERICSLRGQSIACCFDLPLQIVAKYLKEKYLRDFLQSQLFANYRNELNMKTHEELSPQAKLMSSSHSTTLESNAATRKHSLRRTKTATSSRHRKTLSDCSSENARAASISQQNTLLAMESLTPPSSTTSTVTQKQQQQQQLHTPPTGSNLSIDARQLSNPNLLWHRRGSSSDSGGSGGGGLKFGRVNALGRYERDFDTVDAGASSNVGVAGLKHNWSLALSGNRLKNAMRKLVNLPEDQMQEEIAWQVAEMIVKDVTSVTLCSTNSPQSQSQTQSPSQPQPPTSQ